MTIFTMVTRAQLDSIVLGVVHTSPGCEHVNSIALEKMPLAPAGKPNWDMTSLTPMPSDDAAIAACRAVSGLKKRYFMG